MEHRRTLALVCAAVLLVPAVTTGIAAQPDSATSATVAELDDGTTAAASSDGATAAQSSDGAATTNYTRLYVEERYRSLELKPGESETVNVSVENGEDEPVTLSPHLYIPKIGQRPVEKSWVSIDADEPTLDAGAERSFAVTVDVPEDAEIGRYSAIVAFTDEMITRLGGPKRPVHSTNLNVEVRTEPTVTIEANRFYDSQIRSGESLTREITVENSGDSAVPLNPTIKTDDPNYAARSGRNSIERSWFEIDAPSEVPAGESVTVDVTISPPESADRGRYNAEIDLGLRDPGRPDGRTYWQQVHVGFQVWKQPPEPFETTVDVTENTESMTLTLTTDRQPQTGQAESPHFDVSFVAPNGTTVEAERVRRATSGHIDLGRASERQHGDSPYADDGAQHEFTYRVEQPQSGDWTAQIVPHNAIQFGYEITRNETE